MKFPYKIRDFKSVQKNLDYLQGFLTSDHVCLQKVTQSIANASFTTNEDVVWATAIDENLRMWSTGTGILIPRTGLYQCNGSVLWNGAAGGQRTASPHLNGAEIAGARRGQVPGSAVDTDTNFSFCQLLKLGDVITVRLFQNTGAALNVQRVVVDVTRIHT